MKNSKFQLILGWAFENPIYLWRYFKVPAIIVNPISMIKKATLSKEIRKKGGLHEYLEYNGKIYLDSGGFQILKNNINITLDQLMEIYEITNADYFFSLDIPTDPKDDINICQRKMKKTIENYIELRKKYENVIPVIHPPLENALEMCRIYFNELNYDKLLSIGGLVPLIMGNSKKSIVEILFNVKKMYSGPIHVLGLGAPTIIPTLKILNIDSSDSASWRIKAAYGKIMLHNGGERHVTKRKAKFGGKKISKEEIETIYSLNCPILEKFGWGKIESSFTVRALFNAWVSLYSSKNHFHPRGPFKSMYKYASMLIKN